MKTNASVQLAHRNRLLPALLAVPAVLTALGVSAIEISRLQHPNSPLFAPAIAYSFADAVEADDVRGAYQFIRTGQDPSALIGARHPLLTDGRSVLVSPLLWAVATQRRDVVLMLLGFGARTDRAADRTAACLADELGNGEIASVLRRYGEGLPREQCPARKSSGAPLLSFVEQAEAAR